MSCPSFDELLESIADDPAAGTLRAHEAGCAACRQTATCVRAVFRHAALYEEFLAGASQKMPSRWARSIAERVHAAFEAQFAARPICPKRDELFDWLVGGADCDLAIGAHLAMCVRCQQAMGEITALLNGASQWDVVTSPPALADEAMPIELSDRVFERVNAAYEEQFALLPGGASARESSIRPSRSRLRRHARIGGLVAAAATLVFAMGSVVWQMRQSGVSQVDVAARPRIVADDSANPAARSAAVLPKVTERPAPAIVAERRILQPVSWERLAERVLAASLRVERGIEPFVTTLGRGIRTPAPEDWMKVAGQHAAWAKAARVSGQMVEEERHLLSTLAAARAASASPLRQAAYSLLLVRNRLDQNRPDEALAAYEAMPAIDAAEIGPARRQMAARLARTFHDGGRSATAVMLLASLDGDLDAPAARTLADARRAVSAQTIRLVGTGNKALTYKFERWAETRLASSIAAVPQ